VNADATVGADEQHGGGLRTIHCRDHSRRVGRERTHDGVEPPEVLPHALVVPANEEAESHHDSRHDYGDPAAEGELLVEDAGEDAGAQDEGDSMHDQSAATVRPRVPEPEAHHAQLRQREGNEDVDGVHRHERREVAVGIGQRGERRAAHEQHATADRQPAGELREAVRQPGVGGHARHHARTIDEPSLCRHEQQRRLGGEREHDEAGPHPDAPDAPPAGEFPQEHRVHRLPFHRPHVEEQVEQHDPASGQRQ